MCAARLGYYQTQFLNFSVAIYYKLKIICYISIVYQAGPDRILYVWIIVLCPNTGYFKESSTCHRVHKINEFHGLAFEYSDTQKQLKVSQY